MFICDGAGSLFFRRFERWGESESLKGFDHEYSMNFLPPISAAAW